MLRRVVLFSLGLLIINQPVIWSAPISGKLHQLRQPDDSLITVRIWGDEFYQVVESPDGYTLIRDPETGTICYADLNEDGTELISTGIPYLQTLSKRTDTTSISPSLKPHLRISAEAARKKVEVLRAQFDQQLNEQSYRTKSGTAASSNSLSTVSGEVRGICLLIDFPDEPGVVSPEEINRMINEPGYNHNGNNGSVRDFYYEVSGGKLTFTNYVTPWYYTAQNEKSYYDNNNISSTKRTHLLLKEALNYLDSTGFDFSDFDSDKDGAIDAIQGFYAGETNAGWGHGLWPHMSTVNFEADGVHTRRYHVCPITEFPTIGIFCHESGHVLFGWPDLYDYNFDSRGLGYFCLMANGDFDLNPVHPCAYLKELNGWLETTVLDSTQDCTITANTNTAYKIKHPSYASEYYLIENRMQTGRDEELPDNGLAIWHIDRALGNQKYQQQTAKRHYLVTLVQADGQWDMEGNRNSGDTQDLWGAPEKTVFNPQTSPAAMWWDDYPCGVFLSEISEPGETMTFSFRFDATPEPGPNFNSHANFPDSTFRRIVEEFLEVAPYGYFTEARIAAVSAIKDVLLCNKRDLESLVGIEYFTGLTQLDCSNNSLTELDVSALPKLEKLICLNNRLRELNIGGCHELSILDCRDNELREINLSTNSKLKTLNCSDNQIDILDVSNHLNLTGLFCYRNGMEVLDVTRCISLAHLECHVNQIASLDVSGLGNLVILRCFNNYLEDLSAEGCESLLEILCYHCSLKDINISDCPLLEHLDFHQCLLEDVDLSDCESLKTLYCYGGNLKNLDISACPILEEVLCYSNEITTLELPSGEALKTLNCRANDLPEIDLTKCEGLVSIDCGNNDLISLDIRENKQLENLDCASNSISELFIADDGNLFSLDCTGNPLVELDIIDISTLQKLVCSSCDLIELRISGCNSLRILQCLKNPLSMLELSDLPMIKSFVCKNSELRELRITNCPSLTEIDCNHNFLKTLEISECDNLETIECTDNSLVNLNLTSCTSLVYLDCTSNNLSTLNLSNLKKFETLACLENPFETLDLSNCTKLTSVEFPNSYSICIDLSGCSALENHIQIGKIAHEINLTGCTQIQSAGLIGCRVETLILKDCTNLGLFISSNSTLNHADFGGCENINWIQANNLQMETIDLSNCLNLETLDLSGNRLTSIDLESCNALRSIAIYNNLLSELYLPASANLQTAHIQNNMLRDLSSFQNLPNLKALDIRYNYYTFADWDIVTALRLRLAEPRFDNGLVYSGFAYTPQRGFDPFTEDNPDFPIPTPTPPITDINNWISH